MSRATVVLAGFAAVLGTAGPLSSAYTDSKPPCKYEANCECRVPGITGRWKAAYCLYVSGTDDFENAAVQQCLGKADPDAVVGTAACGQNAYWKKMLCRAMHENRQDIRNCIQDRQMIPGIVEKGAGG